jgi:serine/threonine protein kinase
MPGHHEGNAAKGRPLQTLARKAAPTEPPPPLIGRYRPVRKLATSALSEVFLARAEGIAGFEKLVVVKRLLGRHSRSADHVAMFLDEATLAASLHHPNVVQMFDFGVDESGYFCAMEFVHGRDVRHVMQAARGKIPHEHVVHIVAGMAAGLHAVHEQVGKDGSPLGTVHRDVSPTNALVSLDGWVKLIDFGIAKYARRRAATEVGMIKGKMGYMSPEQVLGRPLDRRSDVFCLGVVLHELLTGHRLFRGESDHDVMKRIARADVPAPSEMVGGIPAFLDAVALRALARDPDARYPSARALQLDLEQLAQKAGIRPSTVRTGAWMRQLFPDDTAPTPKSDRAELAPGALGAGRAPMASSASGGRGTAPGRGPSAGRGAASLTGRGAPPLPPRRTAQGSTAPPLDPGPAAQAEPARGPRRSGPDTKTVPVGLPVATILRSETGFGPPPAVPRPDAGASRAPARRPSSDSRAERAVTAKAPGQRLPTKAFVRSAPLPLPGAKSARLAQRIARIAVVVTVVLAAIGGGVGLRLALNRFAATLPRPVMIPAERRPLDAPLVPPAASRAGGALVKTKR